MIDSLVADTILKTLEQSPTRGGELRQVTMRLLSALPGYDWSGIYRLDGEILRLAEYVGAATDHTSIRVGVGVCGTAVAENRNQVVPDVRELSNYLSCSAQTRSEIVVLIRNQDKILGQIDVDGHESAAFDASDEAFLDRVAVILAERWDDQVAE